MSLLTLPADFVPQLEQGMLSGYLSDVLHDGPGDETQRDPKRKEARDSLAAKRDASLIFSSESQVAHVQHELR